MTDDLIRHVRDWLDADGQNWGDHEKGIAAMFDHIEAQAREIARLREALGEMFEAVCGETGFAQAVRNVSGLAYPWPALDLAEDKARAALQEAKQ